MSSHPTPREPSSLHQLAEMLRSFADQFKDDPTAKEGLLRRMADDIEQHAYEQDEHDTMGCAMAKTGIYAVPVRGVTPRTDAYQDSIREAEIIKHPTREFKAAMGFAAQLEQELNAVEKGPATERSGVADGALPSDLTSTVNASFTPSSIALMAMDESCRETCRMNALLKQGPCRYTCSLLCKTPAASSETGAIPLHLQPHPQLVALVEELQEKPTSQWNAYAKEILLGFAQLHIGYHTVSKGAAPSAIEPSKWIAVEDRLPTQGMDVLIYHVLGDRDRPEVPHAYDVGWLLSSGWYFPWDRAGRNKPMFVTHWMPLPEAP